jgi:hypothetical protein
VSRPAIWNTAQGFFGAAKEGCKFSGHDGEPQNYEVELLGIN